MEYMRLQEIVMVVSTTLATVLTFDGFEVPEKGRAEEARSHVR
jgi:hypothetical protein